MSTTAFPLRPIVEFALSDKGGVGKSTLAKTEAHYYRGLPGESVVLFDTNGKVGTLSSNFAIHANGEYDEIANMDGAIQTPAIGCKRIDLNKERDREFFFNHLTAPDSTYTRILADFGQDEAKNLAGFFGNVREFVESVLDADRDVIINHCVDADPAAAESVIRNILQMGPGVRHRAFLIQHKDGETEEFDWFYGRSGTRPGQLSPADAIELVGGDIVRMPQLLGADPILSHFKDLKTHFGDRSAWAGTMQPHGIQGVRLAKFLKKTATEFEKLDASFGSKTGASLKALQEISQKNFGKSYA